MSGVTEEVCGSSTSASTTWDYISAVPLVLDTTCTYASGSCGANTCSAKYTCSGDQLVITKYSDAMSNGLYVCDTPYGDPSSTTLPTSGCQVNSMMSTYEKVFHLAC